MLVAVQLLVIGIGDGLELRLVLRHQHRHGIAAKIAAGHRHHMHAVAANESGQMRAEPVVGIGGHMVEFVNRDQATVKRLDPEPVDGKAEGGMRGHKNPVVAVEKGSDCADLAFIAARRVAQVPFGHDMPVRPEAVLRQRLVGKARTDGFLRHGDDRLAHTLMVKLVEGDEHQRPALAGSGRRLDQKILLPSPRIGALLHLAHAKLVGARRMAGACVCDGNGGNGVHGDLSFCAERAIRSSSSSSLMAHSALLSASLRAASKSS